MGVVIVKEIASYYGKDTETTQKQVKMKAKVAKDKSLRIKADSVQEELIVIPTSEDFVGKSLRLCMDKVMDQANSRCLSVKVVQSQTILRMRPESL